MEIGSELVAEGLTPAEVLDELERVDTATTALAEEFRDVRASRVATVRRRRHARGPARLGDADARAHAGLGTEIVVIALRRALATATEQAVAAAAERSRGRTFR